MKHPILFSILALTVFTSCRTMNKSMTSFSQEPGIMIAGQVHSTVEQPMQDAALAMPSEEMVADVDPITEETPASSLSEENTSSIKKQTFRKKVHSFTEMKEMAEAGELKMSNKDMKTLSRLESMYKGNLKDLKHSDEGVTMSGKAKLIAIIGAIAGVIALFIGSWFFAFVFLLAVLAFFCRWIGIIEF